MNIVDPGPWIEARVAAETAELRAELAAATTGRERRRLRWRIWRESARIRSALRRGAKF